MNGMNSIHDDVATEEVRRQLRIEPDALRRLRNAFYKKRLGASAALEQLPADIRSHFAARIAFHALTQHSRHDSRVDGASKLILRTAEGRLLETVLLRIASGRTSICVSSQVGCAVRCSFCATGQMGVAIDLRHEEIVDQIVQAGEALLAEKRSIRNVVFMGMGEPLLNEDEVTKTVETLIAPGRFHLSPAHVLVSTVGIPEALTRFARRFPRVGLAVSLHSATPETRQRIIPLARKYPLERLREAIEAALAVQSRPIMIEYLLLDGVNDTDAERTALIQYLAGLPVHINLIPYNPIASAPDLAGTPEPRRRQFAAALSAAGFKVTIRYSLGADIAAACGQLVQQAQRAAVEMS
jgi:23S rRNA (adenine2503-C2)-methyltransferase